MLPAVDTSRFPVPYNAEFVAKVAYEACANPHDLPVIALRHALTEERVSVWRERMSLTVACMFEEPVVDARVDVRIAALDQMDVCIAILEGDELYYCYGNAAYRATAGGRDVVGRRMRDVFPQSLDDGVEHGVRRVLQTGEPWDVSGFRAQIPGIGETVWEGRISRLPRSPGAKHAVMIWIRDVTAVANVESSLRTEIALLRAISENSTDVMFAKDWEGRMQFANPAALALIGKSFSEVAGKTDAQFLLDKDAAVTLMENDRRILLSGQAEEVEETVPLPDGTRRVWLSQKRPYFDQEGRTIGLLGVSRDITDRKDSEDRIRAAHDSLQRVLGSITDGMAVLDSEWRYTYFSETGARMLGVRSEDMLGRCVWDLFAQADQLAFGREYRRAVETGMATHFEDFYPAPLNMWIECHCYPSSDGLSVYFRDVTDRRLAQDAAVENERRVKAILEASPVGLAYADAIGRVQVMNNEGKRIWGDPPETDSAGKYALYRGWWADESERHGEPISAHEWPMAHALRGEHVTDTAIEIEPFDLPGTRRIVLHRAVPVQDNDGVMLGAVTAMMDITDFVRTKRAVVEGHHRLEQLANTIPQLAWMADREGSVHWYNQRWLDYTGVPESQLKGWGWECVHDPAVLPRVVERWKKSVATGEAFEMTFPIKGNDGLFRPFFTLAAPLLDLDGNVERWFGTCTDVSALQRVQEDLTKTQDWLQEGLEVGRMVAWEWDFHTDEVRYSDNAVPVLGHRFGTASLALNTVDAQDLGAYADAIKRAATECGSIDHTARRTRPDTGNTVWIRMKGNVLTGHDGHATGIRGILIDVTEQILREQALEDASNRKDEFLAMLSHELRNPLAPIATAAQLLTVGGADPQRVRTSSEIIARQVGHMTRLIDDLLDVSRVTRGLVELEVMPVPIKDIVNNAIEQARPLIEARKHELSLHVNSEPAVVLGDRVRLCQIIVNLLNNAAKYTPQGGRIGLDIAVNLAQVRIVINDDGIGIDDALLPRIFELFTQATRTPDRSQGGLGLGLALVHSLVKMHGGQVEAFSEGIGRGSKFTVTLPLVTSNFDNPKVPTEPLRTGTQFHVDTLSIMVVDDNTDAADMLADVLRIQGHVVRVEYSSTAALSAASHSPSDLYILDIGLPDLDGYELVRRLRAAPANERSLFVALTGYSQAHDKVLSHSAGFDHHMIKPVDLSHLDVIIRSVTQGRGKQHK